MSYWIDLSVCLFILFFLITLDHDLTILFMLSMRLLSVKLILAIFLIIFFLKFPLWFLSFFPSSINFGEFCLLFLLSLNMLHLSLGWLLGFISSHVWMWELDCEESWERENLCFWTVLLEKTFGQKEDPTSPSWSRSALSFHWKDWCWNGNSNNLATFCEELPLWKRS